MPTHVCASCGPSLHRYGVVSSLKDSTTEQTEASEASVTLKPLPPFGPITQSI